MKVLARIIALPFFIGLALIVTSRLFIKLSWNFLRFGGEAIAYTKTMNRKTIQDVFVKLQEKMENETIK